MIPGNYEQIIERIAKSSGNSKEDIERKIEAKRAKLSGLISREGAAQIVASELGISFDKQKMNISELLSGMKKINVIGKVIKMNRVIEYNKNNRSGKIGSFLLADESSNIRTVLWDTNHVELIEKGDIIEGSVVEISGGDIRNNELHLSGFADIKKSSETIENPKIELVVQKKKIEKISVNDNISTRAFVVQIFGPSFFNVCPECGKKVNEENKCNEHGMVSSEKRAILNFVLDDGSGTIRSVLFTDQIKKIVEDSELENNEAFMKKRQELLGKEFIVSGNARKNSFSNSTELIVNDIKEIDIDSLIKELEEGK